MLRKMLSNFMQKLIDARMKSVQYQIARYRKFNGM